MAISARIQAKVTVTESLTGDDLIADSELIHSGYDEDFTRDGTTTPNATKAAYQTVTLSSGSATIDMTSLLLNGQAVTLDGLQPRGVHFQNTGEADMTIVAGASNGYTGFGASFSLTIKSGMGAVVYWMNDNATAVSSTVKTLTAVSSTVKTLDVSGTGSDTLQLSVVAGS